MGLAERPAGGARHDLVLRADGGPRIGLGHLMRCLALAQAWQEGGGRPLFVTAGEEAGLEARLRAEGFGVTRVPGGLDEGRDGAETAALARRAGARWVVVDGYGFRADYQRAVKAAGLSLLVLDDDGGSGHYCADIVLNQNPHGAEHLYPSRDAHTELLLGPRYALLRREFWTWVAWERPRPADPRKVLVTLGGSDPGNATLTVIRALDRLGAPGLQAVVVAGACNPNGDTLARAVGGSRHAMRLERDARNMPELMAWADLAVSAAGSTCLELAFMGLPGVLLVLAENQRPLARAMAAAGAAIDLGPEEDRSPADIAAEVDRLLAAPDTCAEMARRGRALVDASGARRVAAVLRGRRVQLREVREEDCRLLWEWANDAEVRAQSFASGPIAWEDHVRWFRSRAGDPGCRLYIAVDESGAPVGQMRCEIDGAEATASVSIDRRFRGKGYGRALIERSTRRVFRETDVSVVHAYIKPSNPRSERAFLEAGFRRLAPTTVRGHAALHLVLAKTGSVR